MTYETKIMKNALVGINAEVTLSINEYGFGEGIRVKVTEIETGLTGYSDKDTACPSIELLEDDSPHFIEDMINDALDHLCACA